MLNIAFLIDHFNPHHGGAESYAVGLARYLADCGHQLTVYTLHSQTTTSADPFPGKIVQLVLKKGRRGAWPNQCARAYAEALKGHDYDVVQGFNHVRHGDILMLGGGLHVAYEKFNALSEPRAWKRDLKKISQHILPQYRSLRINEALQFEPQARHFIAVSNRVVDDMRRFYPDNNEHVHLLQIGVDLEQFHPILTQSKREGARSQWGFGEEDLVLLFVAHNFKLKGLHHLIAALPAVTAQVERPVKCLVVGRGRVGTFAKQAKKIGVADQVVFAGHVTDPLEAYAATDILVHPSYYDSFGSVVLEAMACGLPAVVTKNCGVSELLTDGQGSVLINMPCTREALTDAIVRALDESFRAKAGTVQRAIAERLPIEQNYRAVEKLYEHISEAKKAI